MLNNKTIVVTEDAYNALIKEKRGNETLSQTILRITKTARPDNTISKRIIETERENVPQAFGEGWFSSSDLV